MTKPNIMTLLDQQELTPQNQISQTAIEHMLKASKWMRFVAIIGFVMVGLIGIFSFALPGLLQSMNPTSDSMAMPGSAKTALTIVYLVMAIIFFFPNLFLYQSALHFKRYAENAESTNIETGFNKLYSLFLFMGILIIIYLVFFAIAILTIGIFS